MTSTPAVEATAPPRPVASGWWVPLALFALTGFSGLLAEQGFEKYLQVLVGATGSASAAVRIVYFLGFALGAMAAAKYIRDGRIARPLLAYGAVQLAEGLACVLFSYWQVGFVSGCLLLLPAAALRGAAFPLIAQVLPRRWTQAYAANLAGALAAAILGPFLIVPFCGLRGAMWICLAIGAAVCGMGHFLPSGVSPAGHAPISRGIRLLLAASFGSGALIFTLEVIWTHLIGVVLGATVYTFSWMLAAVLLGLLAGALLSDRPLRDASLFQGASLLLAVQLIFWDRVPGLFHWTPPAAFQNSFYFAEIFKLCVAMLLLSPPAAILGLIYPRLLASPLVRGERESYLAGYLSAANALGCLCGAVLGVFVLVPLAGSEVSLKILVVALTVVWAFFLVREPLPRRRLATSGVAAAILLIVILGRWWNWGTLTAGNGNDFGQAPVPTAAAPASDTHFLPPTFIFKQEDIQGGFTTVVEQTVVTGEVGHTVRTLFSNGNLQGDDNQSWGETQARFGFSAVSSQFVADYGRAMLIGLGTGRGAAALKRLGYRDIVVAEISPGLVQAAQASFATINESVLTDPHVKLYLDDGRSLLLSDPQTAYDLITVELTGIGFGGAANLYSREFYELAHSRLRAGGVLQQWVQLHHMGSREIASELATAVSVFRYVGLWYYGGQGMLVASDHPLTAPQLKVTLTPEESTKLLASLGPAQILGAEGVARLVADRHPPLNTDQNRRLEYTAPRYESSGEDWVTRNLAFLQGYR